MYTQQQVLNKRSLKFRLKDFLHFSCYFIIMKTIHVINVSMYCFLCHLKRVQYHKINILLHSIQSEICASVAKGAKRYFLPRKQVVHKKGLVLKKM